MNEIINETILVSLNPSINGVPIELNLVKTSFVAINLNSKKKKKKQPRVFVTHPETYIHPKRSEMLREGREGERERKEFAFILIYANNIAYISRILSYFYGDARLSGCARARRGGEENIKTPTSLFIIAP